jgi:Ion channel
VAIGYGDITPVTGLGKLLAGTLGILGVLTTGVIAGLILNWLSERSLD